MKGAVKYMVMGKLCELKCFKIAYNNKMKNVHIDVYQNMKLFRNGNINAKTECRKML